MIKVTIRADGGQAIGMGHIMRCLSLAKEFRKKSCDVSFISGYKQGINRIKHEGFQTFELEDIVTLADQASIRSGSETRAPHDLDNECNRVISAVIALKTDLLVIDTYNVTEDYFLKIKPYVKKLVYIDDLCKFTYPVDVLVNGNITGPYLNYKKYNQAELMLLGTKYNLIRDEFRDLPIKETRDKVQEIMITTGGSDPYSLSARLTNLILADKELKNLKVHLIVGSGFDNGDELKDISRCCDNVIFHENTARISELMLRSDIALSAGGSTLYELCACGTPVLAFIMADNQGFIVKKLSDLGYIKALGWYDKMEDNLIKELKSLVGDFNLRKRLSLKGKNLVDARGAERVAARIIELMNPGYDGESIT